MYSIISDIRINWKGEITINNKNILINIKCKDLCTKSVLVKSKRPRLRLILKLKGYLK